MLGTKTVPATGAGLPLKFGGTYASRLTRAAVTGLLLAGAGLAAQARAQAEAPQPDMGAERSTGADEASGGSSIAVSDIVVTARRRNELLQDVPIAVSAISGEQALRTGINNTESLSLMTPSLDVGKQGGFAVTPFLRGVGTDLLAAGSESPVAVYVDDVYFGSPNGTIFELNSIESVQVLKGPQGTLFGRNATGGVIQVQTKNPSFEPALEMMAGYANYDTVSGSLYGTTGLSDTLAVNLAASGSKQNDGFGHSLLTGRDTLRQWNWNVRGKILWQPTDATRFLLSGDYSDLKTDMGMQFSVAPGTISSSGATFGGAFNTRADGSDFTKVRQGGISLRIDHEASFANLVSISAYRSTKLQYLQDLDGGPLPFQTLSLKSPTKTFSQEIQVQSKEDSELKWIIGGYYFHSKGAYAPAKLSGLFVTFLLPPGLPPFDTLGWNNSQTLNSLSAFGEATYEILPKTRATLGVRYTRDAYDYDLQGVFLAGPGLPTVPFPPLPPFKTKQAFPKLTYRAILDHDFTPDIMGYASYSRGFKSGGYNLSGASSPQVLFQPVEPEILDAYEVGLKTRSFNGALTLNLAAFYYEYSNLQVSVVRIAGGFVENAAAAEIKGIDLDFIATPAPGLRIAGGLGILDTEYTSFPNGPTFTPLPGGGNLPGAADLTGNRTVRSPKLTFSIAPSYTFGTSAGEITLAASYYHNSGYFWDSANRLRQPSYDLVNASISWDSLDRRWGVRVWGKNLIDDRYFVYGQTEANKDGIAHAPPRTYGFTLTTRL